ncbi:hypothetical protein GCM10009775_32680 [Microbacterium aoyamense]|uniref:Uncharacterized protein n=1 Tax=Microbacterium aoyamense TaxID=344166 RepID=A0ABN2PZ42_9MICO|nr:hypothetical protein [Microbacterium aoyamense]
MPTTLSRDDVIAGLRTIVERLRTAGEAATIQLVGGVAISLTIDADRPPTKDVDALVSPPVRVRAIANDVGVERGWPDGWLDEDAAIFLPNQFGRGEEWVTVYDQEGIVVQVGSPRMLLAMKFLAMKLLAVEKRPLRDADDVAILLSVVGIQTASDADDLLEEFYPGDNLSPNIYALVEHLLADAIPAPAAPTLDLS